MEADEFFQQAKSPSFPDQMVFQLSATNSENPGTFSREGVTGVVDLIDGFIMARIFGRWGKTKQPPKQMKIHVSITWEHQDETTITLPWFSGETDDVGMKTIDGAYRLPRSGS